MKNARHWLIWFSALIVVGAAMYTVRSHLDKAHIVLAFLLLVLGGSSAGGRALGIALAGAAFFAFDWLFLPPYNTLIIANPLDWLVLIAFLVTSVVAAQLLELRRRETRLAEERAQEIDRIATLGAETLNAPRADAALGAVAMVIRRAMRTEDCEIFMRTAVGTLQLADRGAGAGDTRHSALLEYAVEHAQAAIERNDGTFAMIGDVYVGLVTDAEAPPLKDLRALAISLRVRDRLVGALRLSSNTPFDLSRDQRRVLAALAYYAALGAERVRLAEAEEASDMLRRADRLKDALLAAVSHDLRTPLTAIKGIANEIWNGGDPARAHVIEEEADRLNALVRDLLELSQLNAGSLRLQVGVNTLDDVLGAALEQIEAVHGTDRVQVQMRHDGDILLGRFDLTHTIRIVVNLLENALKYSPPGTQVQLVVERDAANVRIVVEDRGAGVLAGEEDRIFEPFVRGTRIPDGVRGTGLGLSIARQLAEMQGGSLRYEPRDGGGSRFILLLQGAELASL